MEELFKHQKTGPERKHLIDISPMAPFAGLFVCLFVCLFSVAFAVQEVVLVLIAHPSPSKKIMVRP